MIRRIVTAVRKVISWLPGGIALLHARDRFQERRRFARLGDTREIFEHHFETNSWGDGESVSGPGSTLAYTENIRREIPILVEALAVRTVLDAPCGDFNWFRMIQWKRPVLYIGADIVESLVERNSEQFGSEQLSFVSLDIIQSPLPNADLWHCRDCLFHLCDRDVFRVIDNFLKSEIRYLLTTTHSACTKNVDIPTGSFRTLNLELPPFAFPKPLTMIKDWVEGSHVRYLALWDREQLAQSLSSNTELNRARLKLR